jgi:hypothetical protein
MYLTNYRLVKKKLIAKEAVLKGQPFLCAKLNIIFKAIFLA